MSTSSITIPRSGSLRTRIADYVELTKPRISVLVLITVTVAAYVARWGQLDPWLIMHTLIGTFMVAASASGLNQWLERRYDARMMRTADRPLPAGRLSGRSVVVFSSLTILLGAAYLALVVSWMTGFWALLTWVIYVWVYTPLKTRTSWNTAVGAVSGALPILIGWSSAGGVWDLREDPRWAALFLLVFLWQFPHFMAIAWIYRGQYAGAGMQMLTVVDPSGRRAALQSVVGALALLLVSLVPAVVSPGGVFYAAASMILGVIFLASALLFLMYRSDRSARWMLRASLIYLPAMMFLLVLLPLV